MFLTPLNIKSPSLLLYLLTTLQPSPPPHPLPASSPAKTHPHQHLTPYPPSSPPPRFHHNRLQLHRQHPPKSLLRPHHHRPHRPRRPPLQRPLRYRQNRHFSSLPRREAPLRRPPRPRWTRCQIRGLGADQGGPAHGGTIRVSRIALHAVLAGDRRGHGSVHQELPRRRRRHKNHRSEHDSPNAAPDTDLTSSQQPKRGWQPRRLADLQCDLRRATHCL